MDAFQVTTVLLLSLLCCASTLPTSPQQSNKYEEVKCGYESCPAVKPGMINVHLIPHTHDDVGWLLTVDQYYYKQVQWILDGVIKELAADPQKRFIYVEVAFFQRWFEEQTNATKELVHQLVNEGRLEFILGGWCMNDEASTHYSAIIDQHKLGFEFLRKQFGKCGRTKIGWQIDPFGHSREQASLFAQFGFDGLFFGRLDFQDKKQREKAKTMEMVWQGSPKNLGSVADLFTGVLPNGYNPPRDFCFDITCAEFNPFIKDDPRMHDYNVPKMVDEFLISALAWHEMYATNHVIMPMGSDFNYVQASMWFKQMDKLIKYVNARQAVGSQINVLYSTPSCYLKALHDANRTWTVKQDDFFPYADRNHTFWTGYFTSRPAFKYFSRVVNSFFQAVKQLSVLRSDSGNGQLDHLAAVLGVAQHHDAISGTEKQAVTYDYAQRLSEGLTDGQEMFRNIYSTMLAKSSKPVQKQVFCPLLNESRCDVSELSSSFEVTLYNALSRPVDFYVRLPVKGSQYKVLSSDGSTPVPVQLVTRDTSSNLFFKASLPAIGLTTYFVQKTNSLFFQPSKSRILGTSTVLKGKYVSISFDSNGHVESLSNLRSGLVSPLTQNFLYYRSFAGNNSESQWQASGAYIFRPETNEPDQIPLSLWTSTENGQIVQEVYQEFTPWLKQVWRVYEEKPYVEVEWTVGPIPVDDKVGKEVITRYTLPKWNTNATFFTDANGREILERKLNYRPTWKLQQSEPVAGNYFPVNAFTAIRDINSDSQFTILLDRSQGAASLANGQLELMLHRRLLYDDGKGVGEALNEPGKDGKGLVVTGRHYLLLEKASKSARLYRPLAQEVFLSPVLTFSESVESPTQYVQDYITSWSGLAVAKLPANVHLLTLEHFQDGGPVASSKGSVPCLLRLEHFYEKDEDQEFSEPVQVNLENLFSPGLHLVAVHELTLGGNLIIGDFERLHWRTDKSKQDSQQPLTHLLTNTTVTLNPMEIVTLQVDFSSPQDH